MSSAYDLAHLDPNSFQHMVNALALRVLGTGSTGFGPGPDGGRDGYFEGEAPYPSPVDRWSGRWFIQSKFHAPHLSRDAQKWLINEIKTEISTFTESRGGRNWPDIWIIASNVVPSPAPSSGAFDVSMELVGKAHPKLKDRFHIWGGDKILDLLNQHQDIARRYGHFLTPGHVLSLLMQSLEDDKASVDSILKYLVTSAIEEQKHTKLEQAGSEEDKRPGIHQVFVDLPFFAQEYQLNGTAAAYLALATAQNHRFDSEMGHSVHWSKWRKHPSRASVWFLKGGPGQGKSTIGQFLCQIHRAALILTANKPYRVHHQTHSLADQIQTSAKKMGLWPTVARIPIYVELKQYAQWYGERGAEDPKGVLSYLSARMGREVEQVVRVVTLRKALAERSWFVVFDGLDEVPSDIKDAIAKEVHTFLREASLNSDMFTLCTSRPQGYSGQFSSIDGPEVTLTPLDESHAMQCASLLLHYDRPKLEAEAACSILENALKSPAVKELMTTPLQSHIMAIIVRSGQHPPEKKWELYRRFYEVIRVREANRALVDRSLADLLTKDKELLKDVHNRLGFVLHASAETAKGAQSSLPKNEFRAIVERTVEMKKDGDIAVVVEKIMTAATDRLVLITTPDDGMYVRFQIRQLQEFFAAEFLCDGISADELRKRLTVIAGDPHWQEVMHFLMSALVSGNRRTELSVASTVLQELDDGAGDNIDRTYCRRMARGAMIIENLLEDSVLETDKSLRNLFRERLMPLVAARDIEVLQPLINIKGIATKAWLREFLFRSFSEVAPIESIGAAIVLFFTLQDIENSDVARFMPHWRHLPPSLKAHLIRLSFSMSLGLNAWRLECFLDLLLDSQSIEASAGLVRDYFSFRRPHDSHASIQAAIQKRLGHEAVKMIELYSYSNEELKEKVEDFEIIAVASIEYPSPPSKEMLELAISAGSRRFTGLFELLRCSLRYACLRTPREFAELLSFLGESWRELFIIPDCIEQTMPGTVIDKKPNVLLENIQLQTPEESAVGLYGTKCWPIRSYRMHVRYLSVQGRDAGVLREGFIRLVQSYPAVAVRLVRFRGELLPNSFLNDSMILEKLREAVVQEPELLRDLSALEWGFFLSGNSSQTLRRYLVENCKEESLRFPFFLRGAEAPAEGFRLDLPCELPLLVPLCSAVIGMYATSICRYYAGVQEEEQRKLAKLCPRMTRQYVPEILEFEKAADDELQRNELRAAAVLLSVLHPDGGIDMALKREKLLIDSCREGSHVGIGLALSAQILGVERDASVITLLSSLIDASRDWEIEQFPTDGDVSISQQWSSIFHQWRQRSHAPVTASGQLEVWLAELDGSS